MCRNCQRNRREFAETAGLLAAGAGTLFTSGAVFGFAPDPALFHWEPFAPMFHPCKTLKVQPVLMYRDQPFRERSSYKSWEYVNSQETAAEVRECLPNDSFSRRGPAATQKRICSRILFLTTKGREVFLFLAESAKDTEGFLYLSRLKNPTQCFVGVHFAVGCKLYCP